MRILIIFFLTKRKESVENERWKTEKGTEVTETEHTGKEDQGQVDPKALNRRRNRCTELCGDEAGCV